MSWKKIAVVFVTVVALTLVVAVACGETAGDKSPCPVNQYSNNVQSLVVTRSEAADAVAIIWNGSPVYTFISGPFDRESAPSHIGCAEVWFEVSDPEFRVRSMAELRRLAAMLEDERGD